MRPQRVASRQALLPDGISGKGTSTRILRGALRLFANRGYGGTSIRDIAEVVGIRSATLYAHYRSKAHILAELVVAGHTEHHRRLREALIGSNADPKTQLAALVRAHVRVHAEYPLLAAVANAEMYALTDELAGPAIAIRRESENMLLDVVQRGVDMEVFDVPDVWMSAAAIGGMGMRVAHWYRPEMGRTPDEIGDVYAVFALRLVGARPG